jgi:hypothetical protein
VVVAPISSNTVMRSVNGRPRQFWGMRRTGEAAEQAMLYSVPLRRARWIVADFEREPGLVGELLQLDFPQSDPRADRAPAVRRDQRRLRLGIAGAPHAMKPRADGLDGELRGVRSDPDADPGLVRRHIVHP